MMKPLDCLVLGYYEPPFEAYERLIRRFGERSEPYRDLRMSTLEIAGRKSNYIDLLNRAYGAAQTDAPGATDKPTFISGEIPSLASSYLCAFLRRRGLLADNINLPAFERTMLDEHLQSNPLCVAITTTFYLYNQPVVDLIRVIRASNPSVKIVVGGPLIANHFRQLPQIRVLGRKGPDPLSLALMEIGADVYVVESQGELTLARLITCLRDGRSMREVPNVAYFEGGRLIVTATEPERNAMDDNIILWDQWPAARVGATIQTRTARSCAFKCSFCNYPTRAGELSLASVDAVGRELDSIRRLESVRNVVFIDDTFNVPLPRFKALCRLMIERRYGFEWFSYLRCGNVDRETVSLMAESGCKGVFLGIESGANRILKNMNKSATIDRYAAGIAMLRDHGILTFASFITGFPGETAETVAETYEFIERHHPDYFRSQLWYCEVGTPIEKQRELYGITGQGFNWRHGTMTSQEAMDHIERMFLSVTGSVWLPQWSFDFWIIPYLTGKGMTLLQFRDFMITANGWLAGDLNPRASDVSALRQDLWQRLVANAATWRLDATASPRYAAPHLACE